LYWDPFGLEPQPPVYARLWGAIRDAASPAADMLWTGGRAVGRGVYWVGEQTVQGAVDTVNTLAYHTFNALDTVLTPVTWVEEGTCGHPGCSMFAAPAGAVAAGAEHAAAYYATTLSRSTAARPGTALTGPLDDAAAATRGAVALDANTLIRGIEAGETAAVDAAIAGRTPIVSITAAKEFLKKGDVGLLRQFLSARGGRVAAAGTEQTAAALRNQAQALGRGLKVKDSRVAASAVREGVPIITNDSKFQRFLNAVGIGGIGF
jgi:predicted nucleic acid-binding protein